MKSQTEWGVDKSPVVSDGVIFFGFMDNNNLYAFEEGGSLKWIFPCQSGIHSAPVVYGQYVSVGSDDGRVYAVNRSDGELAWSFAPRFTVDVRNYATTPIISDSIIENRTVIFGANGTIYGLHAQTIELPKPLEQIVKESIFPEIPTI